MAIPEAQLETWSHQGSVAQSSATYGTVKNTLEGANAAYAAKTYEVFLQGSYANTTNIYSESDVDVVIRLDSVFYQDLTRLPDTQQGAFRAAYGDATYTHAQFKGEVIAQLSHAFGNAVRVGTKAINIAASGNRRDCDVLVASTFRRYQRFQSIDDQAYDEGICFFTEAGLRIDNYPKQHAANCTTKQRLTASWFKPTVRIFKNIRRTLVDQGLLEAGVAPSYFIEGLLYNVPPEQYGGTYSNTIANCINWISDADRAQFVCANQQCYLLRNVPHVCWPAQNCDAFLQAAIDLWRAW